MDAAAAAGAADASVAAFVFTTIFMVVATEQHLYLNEKLILIQFNLVSINFICLNIFKVNFARECNVSVRVVPRSHR